MCLDKQLQQFVFKLNILVNKLFKKDLIVFATLKETLLPPCVDYVNQLSVVYNLRRVYICFKLCVFQSVCDLKFKLLVQLEQVLTIKYTKLFLRCTSNNHLLFTNFTLYLMKQNVRSGCWKTYPD